MLPERLLIANRGEIAIRIARAAAELGIATVSVFARDDAESLHVRRADQARPLDGEGPVAYLDVDQMVTAALETGCQALHPGYGFLSESAELARRCAERGVDFVGPRPELLELFGDKVRAREAAAGAGLPVLAGSERAADLEAVRERVAVLEPGRALLIKAVAGGGGRGVRVVRTVSELEQAWPRCRAEAEKAFGDGSLYVEDYLPRARHVEVQIAGDRHGGLRHLGERDCSLQRRFQKLVEMAPAPGLAEGLRSRLHAAALRLAREVGYDNLGTFELLLDVSGTSPGVALEDAPFYFIEANPRLQVEHTVTEEVTGVDLVRLQLQLTAGASLEELGLGQKVVVPTRGCAVQVRVNLETLRADGAAVPAAGVLTAFEPVSGRGLRTDSFGQAGYATSTRYDSLLAKLIAHAPDAEPAVVLAKARRGLDELRIEGVATNVPLLRVLLERPELGRGEAHTRFVDEHLPELVAAATPAQSSGETRPAPALAGARVDAVDPLAVLDYGRSGARSTGPAPAIVDAPGPMPESGPPATVPVVAPLQGTVVSVEAANGDEVHEGGLVLVMESMKMEHEVRAPASGRLVQIAVAVGDAVFAGHPLAFLEPGAVDHAAESGERSPDLDRIRDDLQEVLDRRLRAADAGRPAAVAKRHRRGHRTARENVEDLCDEGTFVELGPLVLAAQRQRRSLEELIEKSPADGMITGVGSINGSLFADPAARCAVLSYDYTVFAGTQGRRNHAKTDRLIGIAERFRMPLVLFAEGGGGRPGDTDGVESGPGQTRTFSHFAQLSGLVPLVGIAAGRCFAGNASLLGCCDVVIATRDANIGMGGPAMIEGGGLGVFAPEEIGPMAVQVPNGVVDVAVEDEAEAVSVAKRYLGYFQGPLGEWQCEDQRIMRGLVPENRLRVYDVRRVIDTLADTGSVLELRRGFGSGMVTALARVEGRALGIVANDPAHLGGAIDADGADKASRFLQLCDAFDLPVLFLCDTPGIMVGPEVEKTALVRHANRMFLIGANLGVPSFTIVLRKSYGLGALAMAGGSFREPFFSVSWPTGEFGGMGLEGYVKLGYRNELAAIEDPEQRRQAYQEMVAEAYERGKALNVATSFGIDDTIDPSESRWWVASALRSVRPRPPAAGKRRPAIDGW